MIPLGFMSGRFPFLNRMTGLIISIFRPVSPLAWLPIGLLVFKAAEPAAIWVIFISSLWPMIINTAVGVSRAPRDYMNVARVLNLSEWRIFSRLMRIADPTRRTVVMVTHDVDEAVLLSDRIVMLTNGPAATIGEILGVELPRPRHRLQLAETPAYNAYRAAALHFLYERQRHPVAA